MKTVSAYQISEHGFDAPDYFQGCGVACTEFADVATGIGETAAEALEDALEQLARQGWDTGGIRTDGIEDIGSVSDYLDSLDLPEEDREQSGISVFVSVRVR